MKRIAVLMVLAVLPSHVLPVPQTNGLTGKGAAPTAEVKSQKKAKKQQVAPSEEDLLNKTIDEALRPRKTERDKLLEELAKAFKGMDSPARPEAGEAEFHAWFDRLSGGQPVWRAIDTPKALRSFFARMAERLNIDAGEVRRDQFLRYARQYLVPGQSPTWSQKPPKDPVDEAAKLFKKQDANRDGVLSADELPAALRADLRSWDDDRDGQINPQEYRRYIEARLRETAEKRRITLPETEPEAEATKQEDREARPTVYRPGRMPAGLPSWFENEDADADGQIGLYEWKAVGRPLAEFLRLDLNQDGFLTVEEWQRAERAATKR